jgi:hypothetical protein
VLTASITHLTLERASSHVFDRVLIVFIASWAPWRAFSTGGTPARGLAATGGIGVPGRGTVGGERVSESVVTGDRAVFVESCAVVEVVSPAGDALTAVDCRLASMVKTGLEVVFGETTTVK